MDFQILPRLTDLLQEFTVIVLREKPDDIVDFAADYFARLKQSKGHQMVVQSPQGVNFRSENGAVGPYGNNDGHLQGRYK